VLILIEGTRREDAMQTTMERTAPRDRGLILRALGGLMLLAGLGAALLGPVEMYVYTAFSEGGRFHYDGFGFGSFMFAYIAVQVVGYYAIAAILIPLGVGHLRLRRWAASLMQTLLWVWLVAGLPLTAAALVMLFLSKALTPPAIVVSLAAAPLIYPAIPLALMGFYRRADVQRTFEGADPGPDPLGGAPLPVRGTCGLLILTLVALHGGFLLRGIFPFFGRLLTGMDGVLALDLVIVALGALAWGLARRRMWAWWGSAGLFAALTASTAVTFSRVTPRDVLAAVQFPPYEVALFENVPVLDGHYGLLLVGPFAVTFAIILLVRRHVQRAA
jgi:hypothetical protein